MNSKSIWSYFNIWLLSILGFLVVVTLASIIYLTHTLIQVQSLVTSGGNAVGGALVMQDALLNLQDAGTAVRVYVMTGNPKALDPYTTAQKRLPVDLGLIKSEPNLSLSTEQKDHLINLAKQRMADLQLTVDTYRTQGYDAARALLLEGNTAEAMEQVRSDITTISSRDLKNIGPSQHRSLASVRRATGVAGALSVLILVTSGAIIWYVRRSMMREQALESTKSEFLSLASHQLRTPATNVKQYLGLMLEGYMGDLTDKQRQALEVAYKNNESEIKIMNDLLDVAKLDLDRIQLSKQVADIVKITRQSLRSYRQAAKEAGQTLVLVAPKQLMATVDESYIKGVIDNILDNAIKYSKSGTRITTTVWREQDYVCISIQDQGLGIHRRDYAKLFNKFSRLDNEFSASSQGSGLGLYWVRKIVRLHRGTVELSTREGKGSIFTVRLPVR